MQFFYETTARDLVLDPAGTVAGIDAIERRNSGARQRQPPRIERRRHQRSGLRME